MHNVFPLLGSSCINTRIVSSVVTCNVHMSSKNPIMFPVYDVFVNYYSKIMLLHSEIVNFLYQLYLKT